MEEAVEPEEAAEELGRSVSMEKGVEHSGSFGIESGWGWIGRVDAFGVMPWWNRVSKSSLGRKGRGDKSWWE